MATATITGRPSSALSAVKVTMNETAKGAIDECLRESNVLSSTHMENVVKLHAAEVSVDRVVGRGGFCVVKEVKYVKLIQEAPSTPLPIPSRRKYRVRQLSIGSIKSLSTTGSMSECNPRERLARSVNTGRRKFVLKQVESELWHSDRETFFKSVRGLAREAHFLAALSHQNIVIAEAVVPVEDPNIAQGIVMEHLPELLPKRLNQWMLQKRTTTGLTGAITRGKHKATSLFTERLCVSHEVCMALSYLHAQNIVFRDLKPDNIGFDSHGTVKLFDFGLAKEIRPEHADSNGCYNLTAMTGGIRYMAPEVGLGQPYNGSVDVFSWSMLMWYILALEPPMGTYTPRMIVDRVHVKGYRPMCQPKWPARLSQCMKLAWSPKIPMRPSFRQIMQVLREETRQVDPDAAASLTKLASESKQREASFGNRSEGSGRGQQKVTASVITKATRRQLEQEQRRSPIRSPRRLSPSTVSTMATNEV